MDENRNDDVMVTEIDMVEDANGGFGAKDGLIVAGLCGAGYLLGKATELGVKKVAPKVKSLWHRVFSKKEEQTAEEVVQHEIVAEEGSKKPEEKGSEVKNNKKK